MVDGAGVASLSFLPCFFFFLVSVLPVLAGSVGAAVIGSAVGIAGQFVPGSTCCRWLPAPVTASWPEMMQGPAVAGPIAVRSAVQSAQSPDRRKRAGQRLRRTGKYDSCGNLYNVSGEARP